MKLVPWLLARSAAILLSPYGKILEKFTANYNLYVLFPETKETWEKSSLPSNSFQEIIQPVHTEH
jgi:hypothetical protein